MHFKLLSKLDSGFLFQGNLTMAQSSKGTDNSLELLKIIILGGVVNFVVLGLELTFKLV